MTGATDYIKRKSHCRPAITHPLFVIKILYKYALKTRFKFNNSSFGPKFANYEAIY